jgi:surfactin synthase thioesterase subunit
MSLVETLDDGRIWLQWLNRPAKPAHTFVWFPFGGGLAHTGKALSNALPADWAMAGIEGPGRIRTGGEPIPDIGALAAYYVDRLGDALLSNAILIGHSVGALVAGTVAQLLERAGKPARAVILGATRPPHTIPPGCPLSRMNDDELFDWWRGMAVDTRSGREDRQLFELHRTMIRADLSVYESARNRPLTWRSTPAMLVMGKDDAICPLPLADEWRRVEPGLRIEQCNGSHLFVLQNPKDYAAHIVDFVDSLQPPAAADPEPAEPRRAKNGTKHFVGAAPDAGDLAAIAEKLDRDGMVHLKGLGIGGAEEFAGLLERMGYRLLPYELGNSPRSHVGGHVYTSSEYSAALPISPHCELSYTLTPPGLIAFCCIDPAPSGGETILVRMDEVIDELPDALVGRFADEGIIYEQRMTRRPSLGRTWPATFGTDDPGEVERLLLERGVTFEWRQRHEVLLVWHLGPGVVREQDGRPPIWFNQADQWHRSTLPEEVRAVAEHLPHDCRFGRGGAIDAEDIATIRAALDRNSKDLALRAGDVLLLDNIRVGHGRRPFEGQRDMLVALSNPRSAELGEGGARWI